MLYKKVWIENFRSLESLALEDLGRINLIVGPNSSGKTSILEAIWLLQAPGNPTLVANIGVFRGLSPVIPAPDPGWRAIFSGLDRSNTIEIGGKLSSGADEKLRITLTERWPGDGDSNAGSAPARVSGDISASSGALPETLEYLYSSHGHADKRSSIAVGLGRIAQNFRPELTLRQSIFLASRVSNGPEELATRFTKLQDSHGIDSLVSSLSVFEPRIRDLSIGYRAQGSEPLVQLRAHISGMASPVPIQLLGEGSKRLIEILLAIAEAPRGLVLIDEVENGFYYRNLESAWRAIIEAARQNDAQLFATTHSAECVEAAVRAFSGKDTSEFRLYRIERGIEGIKAVKFDHEKAETALEYEFEIR